MIYFTFWEIFISRVLLRFRIKDKTYNNVYISNTLLIMQMHIKYDENLFTEIGKIKFSNRKIVTKLTANDFFL